jgi:hypothetical protein
MPTPSKHGRHGGARAGRSVSGVAYAVVAGSAAGAASRR